MVFPCAQQSPAGGGAAEVPRLAPGAQRMLQHAMPPPPPPRSPAPVPPPLPATEDMDDSIGEIQPVGTNETGAQAPTIEPPLVSLDEDPAYLLFHYPPSVDREDRVYFTEGGLLAEINIMFMKIGLESIASRNLAIKVESGTGPATVHGFTKTECKLFIENYENLVMDGRDGKTEPKRRASWTSR